MSLPECSEFPPRRVLVASRFNPDRLGRHSADRGPMPAPRRPSHSGVDQALLTALSMAFSSKAGIDWRRPKPLFAYQTEKANTASGLGASTTSTKSYWPWV